MTAGELTPARARHCTLVHCSEEPWPLSSADRSTCSAWEARVGEQLSIVNHQSVDQTVKQLERELSTGIPD